MIITSILKLEPGKTYNQDFFNGMKFERVGEFYSEYTLYIIREATKEEFLKHIFEIYPSEVAERLICYEYFYEIHSD